MTRCSGTNLVFGMTGPCKMPTVNPTLARDASSGELLPWTSAAELLVLRRAEIKFESVDAQGLKLKSTTGVLYLTSLRLVYVAERPNRPDFKSFHVEFLELTNARMPTFEQPIFGANYLDIQTNTGARIYLTFTAGGAGTFLPVFYALLDAATNAGCEPPAVLRTVAEGRGGALAFVDPQDPSVFYVTQPQTVRPLAE